VQANERSKYCSSVVCGFQISDILIILRKWDFWMILAAMDQIPKKI
jgi:hypothetical protein